MTWPKGQTRTSSAEHKAWQRAVLRRCHGVCEINGPNCEGRAVHADHKLAVAEGGDELDVANGQGACEPCHEAKTEQETARGRQRYYGRARRAPERHPTDT